MTAYQLQGTLVELERGTVLLDTNVLVAYHSPREGLQHAAAVGYLNTVTASAVTDAVLAEAWGKLTKDADAGYTKAERHLLRQKMLDWVSDPTNGVVLVPDAPEALGSISTICRERSLDVVDVMLADLAHRLGAENATLPPFPVASFDGDFYRLREFYDYEVIDPRSPPE